MTRYKVRIEKELVLNVFGTRESLFLLPSCISRWLVVEEKKLFKLSRHSFYDKPFLRGGKNSWVIIFCSCYFFSIIASGASGARGRENKMQSHGDQIRALIRLEANETIFVLVSCSNTVATSDQWVNFTKPSESLS